MRRVVFIGNCQVQSLSQLYQRFADRAGDEHIAYLPSYEHLTDERAATIAAADVLIEQRLDVAPRAEIDGIAGNAERHFVPLLAGGFLWPFAGQPHPRNETPWFMPAGPFDAEMGDSYLNRLIDKAVSPAEAVDGYLALDVARVRHLDRFFELVMDRQRSRDAACGYRIADLIEQRFREEPMFRTPHHPNLRLTLSFVTQFFQHMGVGGKAIDLLHERVRVTPFPKSQLPIHPAVARHFGLKYADASSRYRIREEGRFTFAEYAMSYLRGEWNRDLAEGIALAGGDLAQALPKMEAGLARSPNSAAGWHGYAGALRRSHRAAEAEAAARRAIAIDPAEARHYYELGHVLADLGRLDEADEAAERAVALDPSDPHFLGLGAQIATRRGHLDEAERLLRRAVELEPGNPHLHHMLADLLLRRDRPADSIAASQAAIALEPDLAGFHVVLSRALARADRMAEAIETARHAVTLDSRNAAILGHLATLLAQTGDAQEAVTRLAALCASHPDDAGLHEQYGHLLARLGRTDGAEAAFRRAVALAPTSAGPLAGLSHTLARIWRHREALAAIDAAIGFEPGFAPFHVHRGNQLRALEQREAAAAAYGAALALDPANTDAERQLQGLRAAAEAIG
jgi:tetratricopeptide (TPR) repeat protein